MNQFQKAVDLNYGGSAMAGCEARPPKECTVSPIQDITDRVHCTLERISRARTVIQSASDTLLGPDCENDKIQPCQPAPQKMAGLLGQAMDSVSCLEDEVRWFERDLQRLLRGLVE